MTREAGKLKITFLLSRKEMLRLVRHSFSKLRRSVEALRPDLLQDLHDLYQLKQYQPGQKTWTGHLACGISSHFLAQSFPLLKQKCIALPKDEFGYYNDHVYLTYNPITDSLDQRVRMASSFTRKYRQYIIDPTWRQFFIQRNMTTRYRRILFEDNHPIFIGKRKDLEQLLEKLRDHSCEPEDINIGYWDLDK